MNGGCCGGAKFCDLYACARVTRLGGYTYSIWQAFGRYLASGRQVLRKSKQAL